MNRHYITLDGGNVGRSVVLDVATGDVTVREHGGVV